ncbi:MAG: dephospho-CoA kinase [Gammaproteobacteria bacterium]
MLVIGLTGGIGSGKSAAADRFASHGVPVIDADSISRELVAPGKPALQEIVQHFGPEYLQPDGTLNRARLSEAVFSELDVRQRLEAILHPKVRQVIQQRLTKLDAPYCIVVIPLLVEANQRDLVDRVLLTDSPLDLRYQRLAERDGKSREQVDRILAAQSHPGNRREVADDIISNDGGWDRLYDQVDALHLQYLALAQQSTNFE